VYVHLETCGSVEGLSRTKRFASLALAVGIILLADLILAYDHESFLAYASDSYGNDINFAEVWQYNTSAWNLVYNFSATGGSTRIHDSWNTLFNVSIKINNTLVASQAEAISYTAVYMNITHSNGTKIWTNQELNNTSCSAVISGFYYLIETGSWTASLPEAGITYTVTIEYRAYI
jgi:hypothetical protein